MREVKIKNKDQAISFGRALGEEAQAGTVIGLIGDLGTGKTTLTKAIAEGLGIKETVTSPTFTLIREYKDGRIPLFHFDVYRLAGEEEMYELGYEEYFYGEGLCVVEWADMIKNLLPNDALIIYMEYGEKEGERIYRCTF